jgi:hypothetical protein
VFRLVLRVSLQFFQKHIDDTQVLVGPFLGGFLYYYFGKTVTFLGLAIVALIDGCKCLNDASMLQITRSLLL